MIYLTEFVHRTRVVGEGKWKSLLAPHLKNTIYLLEKYSLEYSVLSDSRLKNYGLHITDSILPSNNKCNVCRCCNRFPCCVLLALSWNANENPSTEKLSRAINCRCSSTGWQSEIGRGLLTTNKLRLSHSGTNKLNIAAWLNYQPAFLVFFDILVFTVFMAFFLLLCHCNIFFLLLRHSNIFFL